MPKIIIQNSFKLMLCKVLIILLQEMNLLNK